MSETTKTARDAAGKALYLEFRKGDNTLQFVVTPDVVDLSGKVRPGYVLRRKISSWSPRRAWNIDSVADTFMKDLPGGGRRWATYVEDLERDSLGNFLVLENMKERHNVLARTMGYRLSSLLHSLAQQEWTLYKQPLVVEVSYEDIENLSNNSTPNALIRRIVRTRVAQGWGESLIATSSPAAV